MYASLKPILDRQIAMSTEDSEADKLVEKAWQRIEREVKNRQLDKKNEPPELPKQIPDGPPPKLDNVKDTVEELAGGEQNAWESATLFISSTFRDMAAERELIVKKIMPELRDFAEKLGVQLYECDLRWGVPKHSTSVDTIDTCLGELDNIREQTKGQPLFLCLLGERYGWIPNLTEIPEEMASKYGWIDSLSITHMEIMQGALRSSNRNALFCIRSPQFSSSLSEADKNIFVDKGVLEMKHLAKLKKKISHLLPDPRDQTYVYDATLKESGGESSKNTPDLEFKAEFVDKLLRFFKDSIQRLFGHRVNFSPPDVIANEEFQQRSFYSRTLKWACNYQPWSSELVEYIVASFTGANGSMEMKYFEHFPTLVDSVTENYAVDSQNEVWHTSTDCTWDKHPICIAANTGHGKTTQLALVIEQIRSRDIPVFYHFCGPTVSENSSSYNILLRRLSAFLSMQLDKPVPNPDFATPDKMVYATKLQELFSDFEKTDKKCVLFFDSPTDLWSIGRMYAKWNNWMPTKFPKNVVMVVTSSLNAEEWIHNYLYLSDASMLRMPKSPDEFKRSIASSYFEGYNKKLDNKQMDTLIGKEGAQVPLWLHVACDELRVFGSFRQLSSKIESFNPSLDGLMIQVTDRLVNENKDLPVKQLLRFMAVAPLPLPEDEIPCLLKENEEDPEILPITIANMKIVLKSYVYFLTGKRRFIVPFHASLIEAAKKSLFKDEEDLLEIKKKLALYIINKASDQVKMGWLYDLVELLWQSDCRKELLDFLYYDPMARLHLNTYKPFYIKSKFRCHTPIFPNLKMPKVKFLCCQPCSIKYDFELNMPFADQCWICKSRVFKNVAKEAEACTNHREYPLKIGEFTCRICNTFFGPNYKTWHNILLCQYCGSMNQCAHSSVEMSLTYHPYFRDIIKQNRWDNEQQKKNDENQQTVAEQ